MIHFNKPYLSGKEAHYLYHAISLGKISGNGFYTTKCHDFFKEKYGIEHCLMTTSCTDALEMSALLIDIQPGDEVIVPAYSFVSSANAYVLRGAKIVFCDSGPDNPNIDSEGIEALITEKTKAIVVVHYAGVSCDMDRIMEIAKKHNIYVVEDAAHAIDSYYKEKPLGSIGHLGAYSFHESKNINCGEGGLLCINDEQFKKRAEIIWEKGTNRAAFFRGEIKKYRWVDIGSSYLPSDINAAYLYAQLENIDDIQSKRKSIWQRYYDNLKELEEQGKLELAKIPGYATNNAHMFYLVCNSTEERSELIRHLDAQNIHAVFHYLSLHKSPYYGNKHDGRELPNCDRYADCLMRLPLFYELSAGQIDYISESVRAFFRK